MGESAASGDGSAHASHVFDVKHLLIRRERERECFVYDYCI